MKMNELLASLRESDALRDVPSEGRADTVLTGVMPSRQPDLAPPAYLDRLLPAVRSARATQGIEALYSHQAEAIDCIRAGEDVVLEAPMERSVSSRPSIRTGFRGAGHPRIPLQHGHRSRLETCERPGQSHSQCMCQS